MVLHVCTCQKLRNKMFNQWALLRPNSLASQLFAQPFVQAQIKKKPQDSTPMIDLPPSQVASNVENVSTWWRHHVFGCLYVSLSVRLSVWPCVEEGIWIYYLITILCWYCRFRISQSSFVVLTHIGFGWYCKWVEFLINHIPILTTVAVCISEHVIFS